MRMSWTIAGGLAYVGIEQVFERTAEGRTFFKISGPESGWNIAGDMVALTMGWYIAHSLMPPR